MRILFGPQHDALHVDPARPGAYEWWYFDALSDDGRWALVTIFLLGSPMSPYYKAVAVGQNPDPRDWCGVFVSLHERVPPPPLLQVGSGPGREIDPFPKPFRWRERAYAYNLYRGGAFSPTCPHVAIGGSTLEGGPLAENASAGRGGWQWQVTVAEPGLWLGKTRLDLSFTTPSAPTFPPPMGAPTVVTSSHTWACVAPQCRVTGRVTLPFGRTIPFNGAGYHDHNFGQLPYADADLWYWGRAALTCSDNQPRTGVFYFVREGNGLPLATLLVFGAPPGAGAAPLAATDEARHTLNRPLRNAYGFRHMGEVVLATDTGAGDPTTELTALLQPEHGAYLEGPFYRRLPLLLSANEKKDGRVIWSGKGAGIGEVFRPARLLGPVASRAMWSRIRRQRQGAAHPHQAAEADIEPREDDGGQPR